MEKQKEGDIMPPDHIKGYFCPFMLSENILKLNISDSEKFLLGKIVENDSTHNDDPQFSFVKTIEHICRELNWSTKKGKRVLKTFRNREEFKGLIKTTKDGKLYINKRSK